MASIVLGNYLGLANTSLHVLGAGGVLGAASHGRAAERLYVNAANGNLVVQNRDELLIGRGPDVALLRTYNSQGLLDGDNNDNWRIGVYRKVYNLTGTVNAAGSSVTRVEADGSESVYTYDVALAKYVSRDGSGAYDTLAYDGATQFWTWTEGESRVTERYDGANGGRITQVTDADGHGLTYTYNGAGLVSQVTDASGETTFLDYSGNNLTQLRTVKSGGATVTRVRYGYDGANRLSQVTIDRSPDDNSVVDGNSYSIAYTYAGTSTRVATMTQSDGTSLAFTYIQVGAEWRVESVTDALGQVTSFAYNTAARTTTLTDALGRNTVFAYDAANQLTSITSPAVGGVSQVVSYAYDGNGNVTQVTDARGNVVTYEYDANGNRTLERDALGNTVTRLFGAKNEVLNETAWSATTTTVASSTGETWTLKADSRIEGQPPYLSLAGLSGNYASAPDSAATSPTGDLDLRVKAALNDWTPATPNALIAKESSGSQTSFYLRANSSGTLSLHWSPSGSSTTLTRTSTASHGIADGAAKWVRATLDADNGASGHEVRFYTSDDGVTWTQLGATVTTAGTTSVFDGTAPLMVGARSTGFTELAAGKIYYAELRNSIGGAVAAKFDPAAGVTRTAAAPLTSRNVYDGANRLRFAVSAEGRVTEHRYNAFGERVAEIEYTGARYSVGGLAPTVTLTEAQLTAWLPANRSFSTRKDMAYDFRGQVSSSTTYGSIDVAGNGIASTQAVTQHVYDQAGNLLRITDPRGSAGLPVAPVLLLGNDNAADGSTSFDDQSDADHFITRTGSVQYDTAQAPPGHTSSLFFDGTPGMLSTSNTPALGFGTGDGSIEAMIRVTSYAAEPSIFEVLRGSGLASPALYIKADGSLRLWDHGEDADVASTAAGAIALNTWTHVRWTRESGVSKLFINGVLRAQAADERDYGPSGMATIGAGSGGSFPFNGWMASVRVSKGGYGTSYVYDGLGRVISTTDGPQVTLTQYDDANRKTVLTLANGLVRTSTHDAAGQLVSVLESANSLNLGETKYFYDANGRLRRTEDPTGVKTHVLYDEAGRAVAEIDGDGSLTEFSYNASNQVTRTIRYATAVSPGNLASLIGADGKPSAVTLAAIRPAASAADRATWTAYDDAGRPVESVDEMGYVTQNFYDGAGRLGVTLRHATPIATATLGAAPTAGAINPTYLLSATAGLPPDRMTRNFYDADDMLAAALDGEGHITQYKYDGAGRLVETMRHNVTTTFNNRPFETLTSLMGSNSGASAGHLRSYRYYNARNQLVREIDYADYVTDYVYDLAGNRTQEIRYASPLAAKTLVTPSNGSDASTPDTPGNSITGDIDIRVRATLDDWTPSSANTLVAKDTGDVNRSYQLRICSCGFLSLQWSPTGATTNLITKTSALTGIPDGTAKWVRATLDVDNGAGGYDVRFYTSDDGVAWTQLGATVTTAGTTSLFDGTDAVRIGSRGAGSERLNGSVQYAEVRNGINGPVVLKFNPSADAPGSAAAGFTSSTGEVWTLNGNAILRPMMTLQDPIPTSAQDRVTTYTYDSLNRVTARTDAEGTTTQFVYDSVGNLVRTNKAVSTADARSPRAQYDKQGRLTAELSAKGAALLTGGETWAQIDAIWAAHAVEHTYDSAGRRTSTTDANGRKTLFFYDADGRLTHTINALGEVRESRYNALGQLTDSIGYGTRLSAGTLAGLSGGLGTTSLSAAISAIFNPALDSKTSFAYHLTGRLAQTTDALGNASTTTYNAFGEVAVSNEALGGGVTLQRSYTYDRRGLLTQSRGDSASGGVDATVNVVYDRFGRATDITDARGNVRRQSYDRLGRVVSTTDALNQVSTTTYDAFDRVLTQTDALGKTTAYSYSNASRSVTITTPEGVTSTTARNRHGETQSVTDGRGNTTTYQYDLNGNLTGVTAPAAGTTTHAYDNANLRLETTDALGIKTTFTYDAANRVFTRTLDAGAGKLNLLTTYGYDAKGQTVSVTDPAGIVTQTTFDLEGQVTQVAVDPAGLNLRTAYTYDARGKTLTVVEGAGTPLARTTQYAYDKLGRRTSERLDPSGLNVTTTYAYDKNDNVVRKTDALGQVTRYAYDADNQLVYSVDALGGVVKHEYDAAGRVSRRISYATPISLTGLTDTSTAADIAARITTSANDRTKGYVYDGDGREIYCVDSLGGVTQKTYDGNGNVVRTIAYATAIPAATALTASAVQGALQPNAADRTTRAVYDAANRSAYTVDAEGYVTERRFDNNGHELKRIRYADRYTVGDGATVSSMAALLPATPPASAAVEEARYDNAGRLFETFDALNVVTRNLYDAGGNRTDVIRAYGTADASTTRYAYDAAGRVTEETRGHGSAPSTIPSTIRYVLDALGNRTKLIDPRGVELAETDSDWARATRKELGAPYVDASGNAKPASQLSEAQKDELRAKYTTTQQFDALGRKTHVTDPFGGITVTTYDALGNKVKIVDPRGNSGYFYFDALGRGTLQVDPEGYATRTLYDAFGNVERTVLYATKVSGTIVIGTQPTVVTDAARDQISLYEYDKRNATLKVTDAESHYEQYTYDALGNKATYRNQLGGNTSYAYDKVGNLLSETLPVGGIVNKYEYDARGNRTRQIEAFGLPEARTTDFQFDKLDRQVRKTGQAVHVFDPVTNTANATAAPVEETKYDARGNVIETIAASGARTLTYYDVLDRKTAEVGALGALTVWQYNDGKAPTAELRYGDAVALPASAGGVPPAPVNAANVREKRFKYDANNALVETRVADVMVGEQAEGASAYTSVVQDVFTKSTYDAAGNEVEARDARGNSTFRYYDKLGQKILEVDAGKYVTRWERDAAGNVLRETKYANKLTLAPTVTSDVTALIANVSGGTGHRVTEHDHDRMSRVIERRILGVESGTVAANGALTPSTANARTQLQYNGLGQIVRQIDATSAVSDITYDLAGRKTREEGAQFTDFESALVRPTTDYEYDGLNQVKRELERGKNNSSETDDRITVYQYDYGFGARLIAQTDATGASANFFYDVAGRITSRSMLRTNADGASATDRLKYAYDLSDREIRREDTGTAQVNETRYNVYGELTGKRTNGGGAGAAWQEVAEYDKLGRVWKSNSGDGIFKVYLYDANGNSTLTIQSAGPDFAALTLDQVMALPGNQKYLTISQFDARNQLTDTYQPRMNAGHDLTSIEQFITQTAGVNFSGGAVNVGPIGQITTKPTSSPAMPGGVGVGRQQTVSAQITMRYTYTGNGTGMENIPPSTLYVTVPELGAVFGTGNYRAWITMTGLSGNGAYLPGVNDYYYASHGTSLAFNFSEAGSWPNNGVEAPFGRNVQFSLWKEVEPGNWLWLGYNVIDTARPPDPGENGYPSWPTISVDNGTSITVGYNEVAFRGQSPEADRLLLQTRVAGSGSGWSTWSIPNRFGPGNGWFSFDWSSWAHDTYEFRYTTLDPAGNVLNSQAGTMVLGNNASISQSSQQIGGPGRAYMSTNGNLWILEQGANAQALTVRYRLAGSTGAWSSSGTLNPQTLAGAVTPGWFCWNAGSLASGNYEYYIEARNSSGVQVNKAYGTFTKGVANSVSALTAYEDLPEIVHFLSQPASATAMKLSYRAHGSTDAYTTIWATKTGTGTFDWDATSLVVDRLSNYDYEYKYETFDGANAMVNKAHGVLRLGTNPSMLSHISDVAPSEVRFSPPQANARKLVLQYRNDGTTGAFTTVTLTRANSTDAFVWDVSGLVTPGSTANLDYKYDLFDAADAAVLSPAGNPIYVEGVIRVGDATPAQEMKWVIIGSSNGDWSIHREQTHNAFGQIATEVDGLGRVTEFKYNSLGLLVEKRDPETDITLANGFIQRGRPTAGYTYDLAGRLIAVRDANGNLNTQALLAGSGLDGQAAKVMTEFHADAGRKLTSYDVFGDSRVLTDENNRVTLQEYDKVGRLTRVVRPPRAANTPGNETGAAASAVEQFAYDQAGNRIRRTNAQSAVERTYYDSLGRVTQVASYAGNDTAYAYAYENSIVGAGAVQVGGWLKTTTDGTGRTLKDREDVFGRMTWHEDLGGHTFTYAYNYAGWLTGQVGSSGQNIAYDYFANGYLKRINDIATGARSAYEYDAEGNRTLEGYTRDLGGGVNEFYQYAIVTYDELNRVKSVLDPKYDIRYEYDANNNRRRVWSYYHDGVDGSQRVQEFWYLYDVMNRFTITMGQLSGSGARGTSATDTSVTVVKGTTGIEIGYDAASQRRMALYGSDGHREDYTYTADGYLEDTQIDGVLRARRFNDTLGRVVKYQEYNTSASPSTGRATSYNADSKVMSQTEYSGAVGSGSVTSTTTYDYIDKAGTSNNAGSLASTSSTAGSTTTNTHYNYEYWDSAKERDITTQPYNPQAPGWKPGFSHFEYDVNGHLKSVNDPMGMRAIRYVTDAQGQVMIRNEIAGGSANADGVVTGSTTVSAQHAFYYLDGHRIGDVGNDGPLQVSYAEELARDKSVSREDRYRNWRPIASADFDQNFEPIGPGYPPTTSSLYTVRAGDTLRSIALAVWGDADMWYLIADANGLTGSVALVEGQTLTIPNKVTNIHNTSETYRVYDPGEAIGDTSPTIPDAPPPPPPQGKKKCGGLGMVLLIVIMVVVTIYTAGAAAAYFGAATSGMTTFAAGTAALSGSLGMAGVAAAAVGGAVGSIVGQGISIATGYQEEFSWKQVATSAIGAGVTAGVGSAFQGANLLSGWSNGARLAAQSATANAITQGVNVATGLQEKFDWRSVAASAIAAPVAAKLGASIGKRVDGPFGQLLSRSARGVVGQSAQRLVGNRDHIDYTAVVADSVGNTIGESLVAELAWDPVTAEDAYNGQMMTAMAANTSESRPAYQLSRYQPPDTDVPLYWDTGEAANDAAKILHDDADLSQVGLFTKDEAGSYVKSVRDAVANPPPGTSNTATEDLAKKYPEVFRQLMDKGIGSTTFGPEKADRFANNSFAITPYPEESLNDPNDATHHKYGVLTYLGPVDESRGITKDFVVKHVLEGRYSYPGKGLAPVSANFSASSNVYAVGAFDAYNNAANLDDPTKYTYRIGAIEQARVQDGILNITTTDHDVYPGTIRRTVIEQNGELFLYTSGAGLNRFNNYSFVPESMRRLAGAANDVFGPLAFRALDQQAVKYLNGIR